MSDTLRVLLNGLQLDAAQREHFERLYRIVAKTAVPPSTASTIRLVFRDELHATTIEPFLATAALEALISLPKRRADAIALLASLVATAFVVAADVDVLFASEVAGSDVPRADLPFAALDNLSKRRKGRYRVLAPLEWFHFSNVDAKLSTALELPGGLRVRHYTRELWVRAVDRRTASCVVECSVSDDGASVVSLGAIASGGVPRITSGNIWTGEPEYRSGAGHERK